MLPEVVLFAEAHYPICGHTYFIVPDGECLVVVFVDGGPELVCRYLHDLGEKFPRPCYSLLLEIIAEGEVAEHFKECAVTCGVTDALKVGRANALLACGDAAAGRFFFAREILLHRRHAGVYEKKAFVVVRDKREGRQTQMSF